MIVADLSVATRASPQKREATVPATPPTADSLEHSRHRGRRTRCQCLSALTRHLAIHPGPPTSRCCCGHASRCRCETRCARQRSWHKAGATIEQADVATASVAELAATTGSATTPSSAVSVSRPVLGTQRNPLHAALTAGVSRFFPRQFGADYDEIGRGSAQTLFDEQLDVRDLPRSQHTTEWVIISTGMFTSFLFEPESRRRGSACQYACMRWEAGTTKSPSPPQTSLSACSPPTSSSPNRVFVTPSLYLAGDTVSYRELADIVDRAHATCDYPHSVDHRLPD